MDTVDGATRSRIMASVRSRGTGPEMAVRSALHRAGLRFRTHVSGMPGRPDVVLPRHRAAVFVHGCFWHRCPSCRPRTPESNRGFWEGKFKRNVERDRSAVAALEAAGWRTFVVWECRLAEGVGEIVESLLGGPDE